MITFLIGLFIGCGFGAVIMAFMVASDEDDRR